jgi:hypothetical protein
MRMVKRRFNGSKIVISLLLVGILLGASLSQFMEGIADKSGCEVYISHIDDIHVVAKANTYQTSLITSKPVAKKIKKKSDKAKQKKKREYKKKLNMLSRVINGETRGSSWKDSLYCGSVVLNRVKSKRFPNSIKEVIFQKRQYACTWDGQYNLKPTKRSVKAAKYLLKHGNQLPKNVIWQSSDRQGKGIYCKVGKHYYCY